MVDHQGLKCPGGIGKRSQREGGEEEEGRVVEQEEEGWHHREIEHEEGALRQEGEEGS